MLVENVDIKNGVNYALWKTSRLSSSNFEMLSIEEKMKYLSTLGSFAPSSHNTQPWHFILKPEARKVQICLDKERVLPASDVVGRQACISLGCSLAFMEISAQYLGFKPEIQLEKIEPKSVKPGLKPSQFIHCANLTIPDTQGESRVEESLYEAIFNRRMNRGRYNPSIQIEDILLNKIIHSTADNQVTMHLITRQSRRDRMRLAAFAELQGQADSFVVNNSKFTRELGDWFLPNNSDSYFGMPGDTFGVQDEQSEKFHKGLKGETEISVDEKAGLAKTGKDGIESAFMVGMITVKKDVPENWIKSGIALGKTALLLESNGFAMAVHAGLAEVSIIGRSLGLALGSNDKPVILFRAGSPLEVKPHSPRLPLEKIIDIK